MAQIRQTVFDDAVEEGIPQAVAEQIAEDKVKEIEENIAKEQPKIEETANHVENVENNLRDKVKATIGEEETAKLAEGKAISKESKAKVANLLKKFARDLERYKTEINLHAPLQPNDVQQASLQYQNEFINETIQKYDALGEFLSRDNKSRLKRSNSADRALNDTYIRQGRRALGSAAETFSDLAHEANTMTYDDYFETRISRLPRYAQNDPEQLASLEAGYFIFKGAAKVGEGMSALDDATENVVSGALHKIGEGFEWLGTYTRRFVRDDLGFSQRVAQNTGDTVQIAAEIFAPGAAAKGIGAMGRVSKSALKARFGENLSEILNKGLQNPNLGFIRLGKPVASEAKAAASARTGAVSQFSELDWSSYRISHVREHMNPNVSKLEHGVFYGNPIEVTNEAWAIAQEKNIRPILIGGRDHYIIPRANSGFASGAIGNRENLNYVLLITEHGTNQIVTSFPSSATTANIRAFVNSAIYGEK